MASPYLTRLADYRNDFTVFSGVSHPDVDGGHPADVCFLSAAPHPTSSGFRNTVSLDQLHHWMDRAVVGSQPNPSPPFRSGDNPIPLQTAAPTLGQHNYEVLVGELDIAESEYKRLESAGIIGDRPRMPSRKG